MQVCIIAYLLTGGSGLTVGFVLVRFETVVFVRLRMRSVTVGVHGVGAPWVPGFETLVLGT